MRDDYWRFFGLISIAILLGYIFGYFLHTLIIGLMFFILWQYKEFSKVLDWLKKRHILSGPSQPGILLEFCREISSIRERHRTREKRLSGYLNRFKEAAEALPDAVVVLGNLNEIEWTNEKATEYIGIECPRDKGLRLPNLVRDPKLIKRLNSNKTDFTKGLQLTSPVDPKLILEVRISGYGDTQKLVVARDVTKISYANQMRKDFIGNASHELRTPLTVISGFLENFADDNACPEQWLSYIAQMRLQTNRMENLIEDLLQLSSFESATAKPSKDTVPIQELLMTISSEAKSLCGFAKHEINLNVDNHLYLKANHREIYSIFSNLVFNAVQYTPANSCIDIDWYEKDQYAYFAVRDNGPGIEARHIPRLTERFYRVDPGRSRELGGTGLGLAIVKHALARYGSSLTIESKIGMGSTFYCLFPSSLIIRKTNDEAATVNLKV